ncbi:auxin response factor 14 [Dorcoceras hygrometricum]|uniref:Auxin response factor 14 n=1 Tax=Dorcoceras hygrometricum TaxID=472368 RepID=A0A2Z7BPB1_9LAMI|nr:auxin response factor 14 [Dorcoceras hygrometricum]
MKHVKAENDDLKNSSVEPSTVELGEAASLQIELSKLKAENELLRNESNELKAENKRLNEVMSSWTKSSVSLNKLQESQKLVNDKSGLGFNGSESSSGETSTQSQLMYDKFKKMSFVKASVTYDSCESMRYDDQNSSQLNQKGKAGIGYVRPENKSSWLKNKLDKEKAKAGSKYSAEMEPTLDTTLNNVQQDLTGNPVVIDLTNVDSTQDQISPNVPAVGAEATNVQPDVAQPDAAQTDVAQPDLSTHQPTSDAQNASKYKLVAAIRNDLLNFHAKAEENLLNLSTHLGFLVDYINRGGDTKKGEGGNSRPQPPPDDQSRPSGRSGGTGSRAGDQTEVEEISVERIEAEVVSLAVKDVDQMTEVVIQREGDLTVVNQELIQVYHQRGDINGCSLENKTLRLVYFSSLYKSFVR